VAEEETVDAHRFVHPADPADERLADDFRSDREMGKRPSEREKRIPELLDGMSAFKTLEQARTERKLIVDRVGEDKVRIPPNVARVRLVHGRGFSYEDLCDPTGHITIWGEAGRLAAAVVDICPASV
jgi:hypothetical protein